MRGDKAEAHTHTLGEPAPPRAGAPLSLPRHRRALRCQRRGEQLAGGHAEPRWSCPSAAPCRVQWDPLDQTSDSGECQF